MIEIHPNLYVGDQTDFERNVRNQQGWSIVHACKEPYHREAVGYSGRGAPKHHPEYLIAKRGHRLMLNLIDPENPAYIPKEIIDAALSFIDRNLNDGKKVLVHCNQGQSRSPGIGLLYLAKEGGIENGSFNEALMEFKNIYPAINMAGGMAGFLKMNWNNYVSKG
ncbi:dual specificity protein phosphatase family protein [Gracilimonas mengyeensis]|uniref:Dual specificity phosphatase, catalytic domain n=1 Tax=Gracilimonas mengyeensis TaxID=1302730 RepID=A0A521BMQ2_9BACT|nr:Dual specificity phosphatase, catalytic domain [Gracilimonas mengyeensis]